MKCAIYAGFVVLLYLEKQMDKYRGQFLANAFNCVEVQCL